VNKAAASTAALFTVAAGMNTKTSGKFSVDDASCEFVFLLGEPPVRSVSGSFGVAQDRVGVVFRISALTSVCTAVHL